MNHDASEEPTHRHRCIVDQPKHSDTTRPSHTRQHTLLIRYSRGVARVPDECEIALRGDRDPLSPLGFVLSTIVSRENILGTFRGRICEKRQSWKFELWKFYNGGWFVAVLYSVITEPYYFFEVLYLFVKSLLL